MTLNYLGTEYSLAHRAFSSLKHMEYILLISQHCKNENNAIEVLPFPLGPLHNLKTDAGPEYNYKYIKNSMKQL